MKTYKYLFIVAICTMALSGCSDFLDAENKKNGGEDADGYFSKNAEEMLVSTYDAMKPLVTQVEMFDYGTDFYISWRGSSGQFEQYTTLNPESGEVNSFYTNSYKAINYANGTIKYAGADSKTGAEARFLRDYCYYILTQQFGAVPYVTTYIESAERNYPRTSIVEIYTNLIDDLTDLYNNSSLDAQNHTGHASKQAVAALLAKINLAAGWDINTTLTDASKGTYEITGTSYFTEAAAWAEKAINGIRLTMSFEEKWSPYNEGNAEEIFSIQYDKEGFPGDKLTGGHSLQNYYTNYVGNSVLNGQKGNPSGERGNLSVKAFRLFEPGDNRYDATFMTTCYNYDGSTWGTTGYYAYYNVADKSRLPIAAKFYPYYMTSEEVREDLASHQAQFVPNSSYGFKIPKAAIMDVDNVTLFSFNADGSVKDETRLNTTTAMSSELNSPSVKKFDDPQSDNVNRDNCYRDIVLFHVSDMYLIAAESYLMAGDETNALAKINDVRGRAGLVKLDSFSDYRNKIEYEIPAGFGAITALDLVLDERGRELYGERQRWIDLRRTKQLVRYNLAFNKSVTSIDQMSNANGEIKWYRPIPVAEINSNTGMTLEDQNPGY